MAEEAPKQEEEKKVTEPTPTSAILIRQGIVADEIRANFLGQKTPRTAVYTRPAKGGGTWRYIKGDYVIKMLNTIFAFQWDFELLPVSKEGELFHTAGRQIIVVGKLTIHDEEGKVRITKTATGKKDIAYMKAKDGGQSTTPLDWGNDVKAAETDALKRAAAKLGIGLDLYADENQTKNKQQAQED